MKKYFFPLVLLVAFEAVAVALWLTRDNLFYLFNFSYIGVSISLGVFLFVKEYRHARRIVQLLLHLRLLLLQQRLLLRIRQILLHKPEPARLTLIRTSLL